MSQGIVLCGSPAYLTKLRKTDITPRCIIFSGVLLSVLPVIGLYSEQGAQDAHFRTWAQCQQLQY